MRLAIIIPAYNEENTLEKVILSLPKKIKGINEINTVVIDDGSSDRTYSIAKNKADIALHHLVNLGVGSATRTGIEVAKKINADIALTIDADGQHNPKDIPSLIEPVLKKEADIVIGTRTFQAKDMPLTRIFGNFLMNILTWIFYGKMVNDSQSGMKAFSKDALKKISLNSSGYEICSEIIGEAKNKQLKITEVRISTIYTDYSKKKGQNILNSINILTKLLLLKISPKK